MTTVRLEAAQDEAAILGVVEGAFGRADEADLVAALGHACAERLSLVADDDGVTVGHILFTPVVVESGHRRVVGMGLAPLAVVPERQRQGIGSALVTRGLETLREAGCPFVIVLGHPGFYPRFGFEPACVHGLASQWEGVDNEAFMVVILDRHAMQGVSGVVRYHEEFDALG